MTYNYTKDVNPSQLHSEIVASSIVTALDRIDTSGSNVDVVFKAPLSAGDQSTLDGLVAAHVKKPVVPKAEVYALEKNDKTLKLCRGQALSDATGLAQFMIRVPGTFNGTNNGEDGTTPSNGRFVEMGQAYFQDGEVGDVVLGIWIVDQDNILGMGAGAVIGSYTDDAAPLENQGWNLKPGDYTTVTAASGPGFLPSGMYVLCKAQKATAVAGKKFFVNFKWAEFG